MKAFIVENNPVRRGGRVVDCTGLENRRRETVLGFKSLPLRHILLFCKTQKSRSYKAAFLCLIASPQPYKACATLLRAGPTTALRPPYKGRNTFLKKCPAICRALGNNTMYLKTVVASKKAAPQVLPRKHPTNYKLKSRTLAFKNSCFNSA